MSVAASILILFVCAISAKILQELFERPKFFSIFIICILFAWLVVPTFLVFLALAVYYFASLPSERGIIRIETQRELQKKAA